MGCDLVGVICGFEAELMSLEKSSMKAVSPIRERQDTKGFRFLSKSTHSHFLTFSFLPPPRVDHQPPKQPPWYVEPLNEYEDKF